MNISVLIQDVTPCNTMSVSIPFATCFWIFLTLIDLRHNIIYDANGTGNDYS